MGFEMTDRDSGVSITADMCVESNRKYALGANGLFLHMYVLSTYRLYATGMDNLDSPTFVYYG